MGTLPPLAPEGFTFRGFFQKTRMKALTDTFIRVRPNERSLII